MKFWDTSALVPMLVDEPASREMQTILSRDGDVAVWWATVVECVSAIGRRERVGTVGPVGDTLRRLNGRIWLEPERYLL